MRVAVLVAVLFAVAGTNAVAGPKVLDRATIDRLTRLDVGADIAIVGFPDGAGAQSTLHFKRVDVYAPGARIVVVDTSGQHDVPRSRRIELIGSSSDGSVRASLGFDPDFGHLAGTGTSPSGSFVVTAVRSAAGLNLRGAPIESTYPPGIVPQILGEDDAVSSGRPQPSALEIALSGQTPTGTTRNAVVAVDTDNELISTRFGNNTTSAADWIADLFTTMNVMYQRDLDVTLAQGTTMLRTTTDPYSANDTPADQTDLEEFGSYWQAHYGSVQRSFALLLSGKSSSGNSASGIAWIDAYCQTASEGGSYSVNQVFTNPAVDVSLSARIVGHELGHNFGAYHTHCTNITNGSAPTGTNTIDQCYNGESGSGCYSGPTSCPSSGPGHPLGTLMSYCNINGCGQNVLQFHPTQIAVLNVLIGQNTPSCLSSTAGDDIFHNGFD